MNTYESHSAQIYSVKKSALLNCSESDTFLMNYIMSEDGSVVGPYGENESKLFRNVTAADVGITENKGTVKYYGNLFQMHGDGMVYTCYDSG